MPNEPSEADIHTFYLAAHHDLWWAKGQLWTGTNWALALFGVIVSLGVLLHPNALKWPDTSMLVVLTLLIGMATSAYLARMHYDIVRARKDAEYLRSLKPSLVELYNALPKRRQASTDLFRGILFVGILMALVSLGMAVSIYVLTHDVWPSVAAAGVHFAVAIILLLTAIVTNVA